MEHGGTEREKGPCLEVFPQILAFGYANATLLWWAKFDVRFYWRT